MSANSPVSPKTFEVSFPHDRSARVAAGATLMDAAALAGVWVDAPCGGEGRCGKCAVMARGELEPPTASELRLIGDAELSRGWRLACQAVVAGPCEVDAGVAPSWAGSKTGLSPYRPLEVDLRLSECVSSPVGAAIDVGTTTLCVSLVDLRTGDRLGIASKENPQTAYGADVMTRIEKCRRDAGALAAMHDGVIQAVNGLLARLGSARAGGTGSMVRAVMVGNTTMLHLAMGVDPSPLGSYPFEPAITGASRSSAVDIGLDAGPGAELLVPPVLSGFLGADIVAALLASGIGGEPGLGMIVDLGTNGEIALGGAERLVACSTAAGPAFEGAQVSHGMRAAPGAIESLSRDGLLTPRVLGGGEPLGVCGSGILDAVAALLESGLLLLSGRLVEPSAAAAAYAERIRQIDGMREFVLAPGTDITLTQDDIRQVQLAKGAVGAGIRLLCETLGAGYGEIDRVSLAGVFGNFLRPGSTVRVGIFPVEVESRIEYAGNAALAGAEMMLASERAWSQAVALAHRVQTVELSSEPGFQRAFIENLSFPTDPSNPVRR